MIPQIILLVRDNIFLLIGGGIVAAIIFILFDCKHGLLPLK